MTSVVAQVVLLIYTMVPMPLYGTLLVAITYTTMFEIVAAAHLQAQPHLTIVVHVLLHISIHIIGARILIMTQVMEGDLYNDQRWNSEPILQQCQCLKD